MSALLKSRKFWLAVFDTIVSLGVTIAGWYLAPGEMEKVMVIVAALQPIFVTIIIAITVEDAQAYKAGVHPNQLKHLSAPKK